MKSDALLFKKIKNAVGRAIADYGLIKDGDRIAVAVSGGKDSYTLVHVLEQLRRRAPINYELLAITIDAGYPEFQAALIGTQLETLGVRHHLEKTDHYDIIQAKRRPGSSYCSICARLRRGTLYSLARQFKCNKLALGHHLDDFAETLLLNQFFIGSLKSMAAKMVADDEQTTIIRPLVYVEEQEIIEYVRSRNVPIVSCSCPVANSPDLQRLKMKQLLSELEKVNPHVKRSLLSALANVQPRHLLDRKLAELCGY